MVDAVAGGASQRKVARTYGIAPGTVATWCKADKDGVGPVRSARSSATPTSTTRIPAGVLDADLRADLSRGVRGLARYVAAVGDMAARRADHLATLKGNDLGEADGNVTMPDMAQAAHAMRALDICLARTPDILTFSERVTPRAKSDVEADALAKAMGIDTSAPPPLRVEVGGKA